VAEHDVVGHRRTDPGNRRSTLLDLTAEGATVRRRLLQERVQAVDEVFADLTPQQRHSLIDLLAAATPVEPARSSADSTTRWCVVGAAKGNRDGPPGRVLPAMVRRTAATGRRESTNAPGPAG